MNMESKIISFLEKIIQYETYYFTKIYTERFQRRLILLPIFFILASLAYQFLNYPTDLTVLIIIATSLFFMFVPYLSHRKRPFLLFSSTLITFTTYTLVFSYYAIYSSNSSNVVVFNSGLLSILSWVPIPLDQCTIRYHFTDIFPLSYITSGKRRKPEQSFILVCLMSTAMHFYLLKISMTEEKFAFIIPLIIAVTGWCLFSYTNIFGEILHAQKQTRLRFDPTCENHKYAEIPYKTTSRGPGIVRILHSSAFEITLKNIGDREWSSKGYSICRNPSNCSKEDFCNSPRPIPSFILKPMETVALVPESYKFDGPCVRIEGLYCFSLKDISEKVETYFIFAEKSSNHPSETRVDFYKRIDETNTSNPELNALLESN